MEEDDADSDEDSALWKGIPGLPERPRRPLDSDCCGSGCNPCVFDLYDRDIAAWRRRCQDILQGGSRAQDSTSVIQPDQYASLKLLNETVLTSDSSIYRIELPDKQSLNLPPGQHLILKETVEHRGITRAYTPVSVPSARGYFDVYIRRYRDGVMSTCLSKWIPGVSTLWRGPFGEYKHRSGDDRLVMFAAGTGITPMLSIIRNVLRDDESEMRLTLVFSVRRLGDVYPREQLRESARHWNFTYRLFVSGNQQSVPAVDTNVANANDKDILNVSNPIVSDSECLTEPTKNKSDIYSDYYLPTTTLTTQEPPSISETPLYGEPVCWRRLEAADVKTLVTATPHQKSRYLVCGPCSYEKDVVNFLGATGVSADDVFRF